MSERRQRDLSEVMTADEIIAVERRRIARLVGAERRVPPWPQFGAEGHEQAARDGFNMALDIVLDIVAGKKP